MNPLRTVRPDVGLGGGISHRVVADPSSQVDVESTRVNDAVCIHQAPFSQLTDVNGLVTAAGLYQEFVGKDPIIRSIFVIVWHDFPGFPVTVKCILKSLEPVSEVVQPHFGKLFIFFQHDILHITETLMKVIK